MSAVIEQVQRGPIHRTAAAEQALAKMQAIVGGTDAADAWGIFWDKQDATVRNALLTLAGRSDFYRFKLWADLPGEIRSEIKRRSRHMRNWLGRLPE